MAGAAELNELLKEELNQLYEEGRNIDRDGWKQKIISAGKDKSALLEIYEELQKLPYRDDFPYIEPTCLEGIKGESAFPADSKPADVDDGYFRGAWLGRCIGCALGQPVEGRSGEMITEWYKNAGKYPIKGFVPTVSGDKRNEHLSTDEKIHGMPFDDDTRFTVLNYLLMRDKGLDFDTWDVAVKWSYTLAYRQVFTAESQAYLNFLNLDVNPWIKPENAAGFMTDSGVSTYLNPYREWIGAQIRADAFGYIAAGRPALAAELAWRDARFTHIKNGVYGEMFFAALIASAFTVKDADKCFETALSFVPKNSRFREWALFAREAALSGLTRGELIKTLVEKGKTLSWVHTLNNASYCIAAITRYPGDFREAVTFAVECGMDTDCNGATVGSFTGALLGESAIPRDLKDPLENRFSVGVSPYDNYPIDKFASECASLFREYAGITRKGE